MKTPWEDGGIPRCVLKESQGLVLASEPIGPFQKWKRLGGRFQREANFPEMIASYSLDRNQMLFPVPVQPRAGGRAFLVS